MHGVVRRVGVWGCRLVAAVATNTPISKLSSYMHIQARPTHSLLSQGHRCRRHCRLPSHCITAVLVVERDMSACVNHTKCLVQTSCLTFQPCTFHVSAMHLRNLRSFVMTDTLRLHCMAHCCAYPYTHSHGVFVCLFVFLLACLFANRLR